VATHDLSVGEAVVKTFRSYGRGEHRREWEALVLLDRYAPGLAPRPLTAELDAQLLLDAVEDRGRLRDARRFYACYWLAIMLPGQRGHDLNPPSVLRERALRLLALL
jgi:hypothetical protein